jgi:hypothetical protein
MNQPGDHTVAMKRGAKILGGDEEILPSLILSQYMTGTSRMDLQLAGEEIGRLRKNEVILAYPDDPACTLQRSQSPLEKSLISLPQPDSLRDRRSLEGFLFQVAEDCISQTAVSTRRFVLVLPGLLLPMTLGASAFFRLLLSGGAAGGALGGFLF